MAAYGEIPMAAVSEAGRRKSTRGLLALSGRGVQYVVASP